MTIDAIMCSKCGALSVYAYVTGLGTCASTACTPPDGRPDNAYEWGSLYDYATGEYLRPATRDEYERSVERGDSIGAIDVDGRSVYVHPPPECEAPDSSWRADPRPDPWPDDPADAPHDAHVRAHAIATLRYYVGRGHAVTGRAFGDACVALARLQQSARDAWGEV